MEVHLMLKTVRKEPSVENHLKLKTHQLSSINHANLFSTFKPMNQSFD